MLKKKIYCKDLILFPSHLNLLAAANLICEIKSICYRCNRIVLETWLSRNSSIKYEIALEGVTLKLVSAIFYQIFIFSLNDSPSETMGSVFYFIEKALFVLKIFKFL